MASIVFDFEANSQKFKFKQTEVYLEYITYTSSIIDIINRNT